MWGTVRWVDCWAAEAPAEGAADGRGNPAPTGGAEATDAGAVTWDIDVTSFLSHERVQYYLDFFQGPARERFGAWLQRMPRQGRTKSALFNVRRCRT